MGKSLKERLAEKREKLGKGGGGDYNYFVVKKGTTRFRHMPVGEDMDWSIEATTFFLGKQLGMVVSPHTFGEKCAIMETYNKLSESKKESDRELAKRFKPGRKFFSPVARYKDEKGKELDEGLGVKLLLMTPGLVQDAIDYFLDDDEAGDFTDVKTGYDMKYTRTGEGLKGTEYSCRNCQKSRFKSALGKQTYNPTEMLKAITPSYKETKELIEKYLSLPVEDEATEEKPEKKSSKDKTKKKKKSKDL